MISTTEAAKKLNVVPRRVRVLCEQGRIKGAKKVGRNWTVPDEPKVIQADRVRPSKIEMQEKKGKRK